ncbi:MAG: chromosome partitioning protein [Candidatus Marinimicrobia bacterium]|nr:chromosome partitioning protein [Candidatus Neomarinimicrobiota bacterium]|tara:strand:+ start:1527 stop:2630 length:1104 start_codon:yes stop_codon:yes gene_type:complete
MNKNIIIENLKEIKYPGYTRDIVSFGIVENVIINDNSIQITLKLSSEATIKEEIQNSIILNLKEKFPKFDIQILFNKSEQKTDISANIKALKNVKHIIAIASGKGGVGKSTTTVNLGAVLAQNFKVGILDLDIYGPSLPTALGIQEMPKMSDNNLLLPIEKYGMKLMSFGFLNNESAPTIWRGPMVSRMTEQFFEQVNWGDLDILLLDLPPGTGDIQLTLVQKIALSGAIIITTPQDLALLDVKKASDMFSKLNTPIIGVIENMANLKLLGDVKDTNGNLINGEITIKDQVYKIKNGSVSIDFEIFKGQGGTDESSRLNVPLLSKIPIDPDLTICTDKGTPYVYEHSTYITECYKDIANKIKNILSN